MFSLSLVNMMGIDIQVWRFRIGVYTHRKKERARGIRGYTVHKGAFSLSIKLVIFGLLLIANDIESNPGPTFTAERDRLLESLKEKCSQMETKFETMHQEMMKLASDNKRLQDKCTQLEIRCENGEAQSRRDNLIFHNIPHKEGNEVESWEETEASVREHLKEMEIPEEEIKFERCHRLNPKKKSSPVVVKFSFYKDRDRIFKQEKEIKREKRKAQTRSARRTDGSAEQNSENDIFITEDHTQRVRKVRSMLRPFMDEAFRNKQKARLSYDKLIIDNRVHWYDDVNKCLQTNKPAIPSCLDYKDI